jgi:hypothetical protein
MNGTAQGALTAANASGRLIQDEALRGGLLAMRGIL